MKIRQGFVSNSSSTSFCVCGFHMSDTYVAHFPDMPKEEYWDYLDEKQSEANKLGLEFITGDCGGVVGLSIGKMKKTESLVQFERRAKKLLEELLGRKLHACESISITYGEIHS